MYANTNEYVNAIPTTAVGQSSTAYMEPVEQFESLMVRYTSSTGLLTDLILTDGELEESAADTVLGMSLTVLYTLTPRM